MATNTKNLGLLKKDVATDGNETFNIKTMLNDNWDKIDTAFSEIENKFDGIDIPKASTTKAGIVQLTSNLGTSEALAVTQKALNTVSTSVETKADKTEITALTKSIETKATKEEVKAVTSSIGSPNLVPLTNTADTYVRAYGASVVTTRERGDGAVIGRCTAEDSVTHALGLRIGSKNGYDMPIKLKKGVKYTLSFKARTNKAMKLNYVYILNKTTSNIALQNSLNSNSIDENFAKYYVTFTYNGEDDEGSLVMIALYRAGNADLVTGDYIEVVDVTVTEGETASNWSPSPQDAKDAISELQKGNTLSIIKSQKDENGIYTTITYKRKSDNTIYATSVLSGGTSPLYTTRTLSFYNAAGTQISEKYTYSLSYDEDDELISEV